MEIKTDVTIKTWDGTWTYHPKVLVTPKSVEDLVEILTDEVRFPSPVRPAGSMHSTARMNGDDGGTKRLRAGTAMAMTASSTRKAVDPRSRLRVRRNGLMLPPPGL